MLIERLPEHALAVLPKPDLLLFGAGGHARVVADAALCGLPTVMMRFVPASCYRV